MQEHYQRLGITESASPAQIKAAYHAKLREFPAHKHPQEFKAIRAAYDAVREGGQATSVDIFKPRPIEAQIDEEQLDNIRQRATAQATVTVADLIHLTF